MGRASNDTIVENATGADSARDDAAVRAYARAGGDRRLILASVVGFVAFNAGSTWLFGIAEKCGILHFASQFSGSGERFDWLVQGCTVPASVQQILLPDFLVMGGYWLMFTAILVAGWWRITVPALRRATWVLWLPTIAIACDAVEYVLLTVLMYKRPDGQFAYRGDGGLINFLQMAVSSAKWLAVATMAVAGLVAAAVWFTRRHAPFPPPAEAQHPIADVEEPEASSLPDRLTRVVLAGLTLFIVAWVLGLFMTHCAIDSGQLGPAYCAPPPIPADHFAAPSVVFAVIGLVCLAGSVVALRRGARVRTVGFVLITASLFLAVWLVWAPAWFRSLDDATVLAAAAGALVLAGAVAGLFPQTPGPRRWALRALVAAGMAAWALVVMYAVAASVSWSPSTPWGTISVSATSRWSVILAGAILVTVYVTHTVRHSSATRTRGR